MKHQITLIHKHFSRNVFEVKHIPNISDTINHLLNFKDFVRTLLKRLPQKRSKVSVLQWQNMTTLTICSPQRWAGSTYTQWWRTRSRCTGWPGPASWSRTHSRFCRPKKMWRWSTWRRGETTCHWKILSPHRNPQYNSTDLHLNENGPKWKDSSEADDDSRLHEPEWAQQTTWVWLFTVKVPHQISSSRAEICDLLCSEKEKGKCRHNWGNSSKVWH